MTAIHWSLDLSALRVLAALLLTALSVLLCVLQYRRGGRRKLEAVTETIRMLAIGLLAFTLLKPERVRIHQDETRPALAVLVDASGSMATPDADIAGAAEPVSREAWAEPLQDPNMWAALASRYRIQIADFSAPTADGPTTGTDIHAPLDDWARRPGAARALVLVGDGDWTEGPSPIEAATRLREQDTPVFAVTVGSSRFLPDIEMLPVRAPAHVQAGEQVFLPFVLQSRMERDANVVVALYEDDVERARRSVFVSAMSQTPSSITFVPARLGEWDYRLVAEPLPEERRIDNNEQAFRMAVRHEMIRMLIVEAEPRWEFRYLRNAARRDAGVTADIVMLHPRISTRGEDDVLPVFPQTLEELSRYDVVFLGDVAIGENGLRETDARHLRTLVTDQAAGLVFMPGPAGRWVSWLDSPLDDLLPVELDPAHPRGHGTPIAGGMALTVRGSDHRLTRLASLPEQNQELWGRLPGFFWYAPALRARPGADVLAVHAQSRNMDGRVPLIVSSTRGSGKILYMGHDAAWRWRRGVEDLQHYRFWSQVFRWMSYQRHLAHGDGLRFFFTPEAPMPGDRLWVQATPLNSDGFPMGGVSVEAVLAGPDGRTSNFALRESADAWGVYHGDVVLRGGGSHTLLVRCLDTGAEVEQSVQVLAPDVEPIGRPVRHEVMQEIADITGGAAFRHADGLTPLLHALIELPPRPPRETRFRLWAHPIWLALLAAHFGAYWVFRKALGRI